MTKLDFLASDGVFPIPENAYAAIDDTDDPRAIVHTPLLYPGQPLIGGAIGASLGILGVPALSFPLDPELMAAQSMDEVLAIQERRTKELREKLGKPPATMAEASLAPAPSAAPASADPPASKPEDAFKFVDGTLKFSSNVVSFADLGLSTFAPEAHKGADVSFQVGSVFLSSMAAASAFDRHGLSWKSAPSIAAAALDIATLVGAFCPSLRPYLPAAKFVCLGLKTVSSGAELVPGRAVLRQTM